MVHKLVQLQVVSATIVDLFQEATTIHVMIEQMEVRRGVYPLVKRMILREGDQQG